MRRVAVVQALLVYTACASAAREDAPDLDSASDARADEPAEGDASAGAPPAIAAACAPGFVRCGRLCLAAQLVDASCRPAVCATGIVTSLPARSSRGFQTSFEFSAATSKAILRYQPGPAALPLTATLAVDVHARVNHGPLVSASMVPEGGGYRHALAGVKAGDVVRFYFTPRFGPNTFHPASPGTPPAVDSAWFERVAGAPPPAPPSFPLVTTLNGRFRDRHRNEWRYDHWVGGYQVGATFTLSITDRASSLDFEVVPAPSAQVGKVDLKWYDVFGATPLCHDPPALAGLAAPGGMARSGNRFSYTVTDVTPGQLVDFELTLTDLAGPVTTYYSEWFHYRVGTGRPERRVQHPWAYAGGDASADGITVPQFAFAQHVPTLAALALERFLAGKIAFETDFASERLVNPPTAFDCRAGHLDRPPVTSPLFAADPELYRGKLGPSYDQASCAGCHHLDGRGRVPDGDAALESMIVVFATPHPVYGAQLSHHAVPGAIAEGEARLTWETVSGAFDDGTPYTLWRPRVKVIAPGHGPVDESKLSLRVAPAVFGLGLLEAVPEATLVGLADPSDADGDGISGRVNRTADARVGRFGWKATQPGLREQTAAALANDMGIQAGELAGALLDRVADYLRGLAVPPRDNYLDPAALRGKALFQVARCDACHVPNLVTAVDASAPELRAQVIQPFTDLLLHDMGTGLADGRKELLASGREWRTPPLWGAGMVASVLHEAPDPATPALASGPPNYLHDGRASTLMEAILWHGGEADGARRAVLAMSAAQRADLVAYVRYPFADPVPITRCPP